MDDGDGYMKRRMFIMLLNCTLTMAKMITLCCVYFPQVKQSGGGKVEKDSRGISECLSGVLYNIVTLNGVCVWPIRHPG